jgi:leader peptidase (prepilin peptidase)/N-methyltransferase
MPWVVVAAGIAGLLAGSFLNVLVWRGPTLWGLEGADRKARGTLAGPRSRCPVCRAAIASADLIPIVSYLRLGGRCRACATPISLRYPLVEALAALACVASVAAYGATIQAAAASVFLLALIALAAIDFETGYLPEMITVPTICLGLLVNLFDVFAGALSSIIGASAGYAAFLAISTAYRSLRGREGLGLGDAALFAAIGAWCGWEALAPAAFVASGLGILHSATRAFVRKVPMDGGEAIAFGPYLCAAGAAIMIGSAIGPPY